MPNVALTGRSPGCPAHHQTKYSLKILEFDFATKQERQDLAISAGFYHGKKGRTSMPWASLDFIQQLFDQCIVRPVSNTTNNKLSIDKNNCWETLDVI